jgi:hypothetical protein
MLPKAYSTDQVKPSIFGKKRTTGEFLELELSINPYGIGLKGPYGENFPAPEKNLSAPALWLFLYF